MTEALIEKIILAVITAIPPTLVALAGYRQSVKNTETTKVIEKKTDEIHALADGNLTKQTSALELANEKIAGLERLLMAIADAKNAAAVATALATPTVPLIAGPPGPAGPKGEQGPQGETGQKGKLFG